MSVTDPRMISRVGTCHKRTCRQQGFTLIELLATIGIISILAAILIPTISKVRDSAEQTKCLANLRSLGTGIQLYTQEHNRSLPQPIPLNQKYNGNGSFYNDIPAIVEAINPYLGAGKNIQYGWGTESPPNPVKVWECPSDKPNDQIGYEREWHGSSYNYQWQYGGRRVTDPMLSAYTEWYPEWSWILEPVGLTEAPIMWDLLPNHSDRRNVVFLDGHVEFVGADWTQPYKYK